MREKEKRVDRILLREREGEGERRGNGEEGEKERVSRQHSFARYNA